MTAVEVRPGRSGPVVLCSDGLAGTWPDWLPLADAAPDMRWVAVVRDAIGLDEAAHEIVTTLDRYAVERAPLVGHSMGGFVVEAAARLHPDRVSSLTLLDGSVTPAHPVMSLIDRLGGVAIDATVVRSALAARVAGRLKRWAEPARIRRDPERRALVDPLSGDPRLWRVVARELVAYQRWAARLEALRRERPLPPVAIRVVTAGGGITAGRWERQQADLVARLRSDSGAPAVHHHVIRAGHLLQLAEPERIADLIRPS